MTLARLSNNWFPSFPSLLDNFFEGNMMDRSNSNFAASDSSLPAVNVKETDNEYLLDVAVPGMDKDDIKVSYDNDRLTIASEIKNEHVGKEGEKITRREFNYQSFRRSFNIPENSINAGAISANYKDGILHLTLPKREEAKPKPAREISIS